MRRSLLATLLALGVALLPACADDTTGPEKFAVTVTVVDNRGNPVPDLLLNVTSDNPYLPESYGKAATWIPFTLVQAAHARLTVEDVDGETRKVLSDEMRPAGVHRFEWDGRDDTGVHLPSGYYTARLVVTAPDTDDVLFTGTASMLMCLLDAQPAPVGVTDADGRVVLSDRRLFPHLYGLPPLTAADEVGDSVGTFSLTKAMIFALADTASSTTMFVVADVPGPTSFEFLWQPLRRVAANRPTAPLDKDVDVPPIEFGVGPVYPNPFN